MAKVLTFQPKRSSAESVAIPDSSAPLEERMKRGDLRKSKKALCECGHLWYAPTIGKCPRCGLEGAKVVLEQELDYKRV